MKLRITTILIFIATIIGLSSCHKAYDTMIIGKWKHGNISAAYDNTYWIFSDDGRVTIVNDPSLINRDTTVGHYKIDASLNKINIFIDGIQEKPVDDDGSFFPAIDGKYQADVLTNKELKMTRREYDGGKKGGAYVRREFKKIK